MLLLEGRGEKISDSLLRPRLAMLPGLISCNFVAELATMLAPTFPVSASNLASGVYSLTSNKVEKIRDIPTLI